MDKENEGNPLAAEIGGL
jgi:chromosome segregation ATPase